MIKVFTVSSSTSGTCCKNSGCGSCSQHFCYRKRSPDTCNTEHPASNGSRRHNKHQITQQGDDKGWDSLPKCLSAPEATTLIPETTKPRLMIRSAAAPSPDRTLSLENIPMIGSGSSQKTTPYRPSESQRSVRYTRIESASSAFFLLPRN